MNSIYITKNVMLSGQREVKTQKSRLKYEIKYDTVSIESHMELKT